MKKISISILLLCCGLISLGAQSKSYHKNVVESIIKEGTTNNQAMNHLDVLTNRIGGRLIGSNNYDNAVAWAASKFKEWGWDVSVEEAGETKVGFNRGPSYGACLSAEHGMVLHFATPSYTAGTKGLQKGHVLIEPKTQRDFDNMKKVLKGAWVLVSGTNEGWPIVRTPEAREKRAKIIASNEVAATYNRNIMMRMRYGEMSADSLAMPMDSLMKPVKDEPGLFYEQMVDAGVLGFIQSSKVPIRALWDKETVFGKDSDFDHLPTVPDIKLDEDQYKIIYKMAAERRSFLLEFNIRNNFRPGPVKFHSVVATLKGSKYPDEYVMLSGHLDAYDVATGGVDCGSGVTPSIEAARLLSVAQAKPLRSIQVVLFAGEEFGLLGAYAYVKNHKDRLDKISNLFNRDGGPTLASGIRVPQAMKEDFEAVAEPLNDFVEGFKFKVEVGTRPRPKQAGGTDASVFSMAGIPAISFSNTDPKGYFFEYGEIWHTERDLYNKSIPEYQEQTAVVHAVIAYGIANLDHLLSRDGLFSPEQERKPGAAPGRR